MVRRQVAIPLVRTSRQRLLEQERRPALVRLLAELLVQVLKRNERRTEAATWKR